MEFASGSFDRETILSKTIHSYFQLARMVIDKADEIEKRDDKVILIADDEPLTFELISEYFKDADLPYKILKAETGSAAYKIASTEFPDLIITDWLMPVYDGLDLIKKLKNHPRTREIPVIMVTGAEVPNEEFNKVLAAGAVDFIRKPIEDDELLERVKAALALRESLKETELCEESAQFKNQFLNLLKDTTPGPIFFADTMGKLLGCNEGFAHLVNRATPDIIEKHLLQILPREVADQMEICFETIKTPGVISNFEIEKRSCTGGTQSLLLSCVGFGKEDVEVIIGSFIDITEIVEAKREELERRHCNIKEQFERELTQLQSELDIQKKELETQVELLIHSRSIKTNLIELVSKLQPFLTAEGKGKFYSVLKQLNWELNGEMEINALKKFDEMHLDFYTELENACPGITKNEKRLCAYLRMNHGATDIAKIMNKSLNSVNVAFNRIRSKAGVATNRELKTFLANLFLMNQRNLLNSHFQMR